MLLNAKLNDIDWKMMWTEAVYICKHVRKSMANTGSTNIPFGKFYGEKPNIIYSF